MISKFEGRNLNNAGLKKSQTTKLGDFVYLILGLVPLLIHYKH